MERRRGEGSEIARGGREVREGEEKQKYVCVWGERCGREGEGARGSERERERGRGSGREDEGGGGSGREQMGARGSERREGGRKR